MAHAAVNAASGPVNAPPHDGVVLFRPRQPRIQSEAFKRCCLRCAYAKVDCFASVEVDAQFCRCLVVGLPLAHGAGGLQNLEFRVSGFGVWGWVIWITFVKNLWQDGSGLAHDSAGHLTAYFWVHLTLAVASFVLGTAIGVIGWRGVRAREPAQS